MKMKSRIVEFWGRRHRITPCLVDKVFGDGKQIIFLTPLNTRPNYYMVGIDSSVDINAESFLDDVLPEIQEEIEEEFGPCHGPRGGNFPFPAPDWDCGCAWGSASEEEVEVRKIKARKIKPRIINSNNICDYCIETGFCGKKPNLKCFIGKKVMEVKI